MQLNQILQGDALEMLKTLPDESVNCCVLAGCPAGGIVLDPFLGAGTTGVVALKNDRNFIGIELNPKYIQIAKKRLSKIVIQKLIPFNLVEK